MATVSSAKAKYVRKKDQMIANYKRIISEKKATDLKRGLAKFLGVPAEQVADFVAKNWAAAVPSMKKAYETVMKTSMPETKWESRIKEKLITAVTAV